MKQILFSLGLLAFALVLINCGSTDDPIWSYDDRDTMHTVPCVYEDYKRYTADGVPKLAMKKDGKWGWVNWLTGKPMSEFNYETTDDLPYPHYKQRLY